MNEKSTEKLSDALNEICDAHLEEAAKPKKSKKVWILRLTAAAAAVAVMVGLILTPYTITAKAVSLHEDPRTSGNWKQTSAYSAALTEFYTEGSMQFLQKDANSIWSPVNAFIALSMAAEVVSGESRQQILDLFGIKDLDALRDYSATLWEGVYLDNGKEICTLANSLWLDNSLQYNQKTMDSVAYYYYADVYKGKMGSKQMNNAIGAWLNQNTGGLLKNAADSVDLDESTLLALYSTLYLQSKWEDAFNSAKNTKDVFHSPSGDKQVTYMHQNMDNLYFWGEHFGAVRLHLKSGSYMWFILPDEGYTVEDILTEGDYIQLITGNWEQQGSYKVNLSVPKFDITYGQDLADGLKKMGVTDIFDPQKADFSAFTDTGLYFTSAEQNVRLMIDEEGVKAAAYIELPTVGSVQPPDETVDFVLDRPFLFVVSKSNVPLFVGAVSEP